MTSKLARLILLVLAFASSAPAASTNVFDPVIDALLDRRAAITPPTRDQRREYRALGRVVREFAAPSATLAGDLALAARAARRMDGDFRTDPNLARLLAASVDELVAAANAERARLALWAGRLETPARESLLARGLAAAQSELDHAAVRGPDARARLAARGCRRVERTRAELDLVGDPPPIDPDPPMPDFAIADVNPASATSGTLVSPRDYVDKISAWYFGRAG